jgi:hypothetical protein
MNEKNDLLRTIGIIAIAFVVGIIAGGFFWRNLFSPRSTGINRVSAERVAREIVDGERRRLETDQRLINGLGEIQRRNKEADSSLRELGELSGGSFDILKVLREKINILQNEHNSLRDDLARFGNLIPNSEID